MERQRKTDWLIPHVAALRRGTHARSWIRLEALKLELAINRAAMAANEQEADDALPIRPARKGLSAEAMTEIEMAAGFDDDANYEYKYLTQEQIEEIRTSNGSIDKGPAMETTTKPERLSSLGPGARAGAGLSRRFSGALLGGRWRWSSGFFFPAQSLALPLCAQRHPPRLARRGPKLVWASHRRTALAARAFVGSAALKWPAQAKTP